MTRLAVEHGAAFALVEFICRSSEQQRNASVHARQPCFAPVCAFVATETTSHCFSVHCVKHCNVLVQVCSECPLYTAIWVAAVLALIPFLWRKAKFTGDEVHGEGTRQSSLQWLHCCHVAALVTQKVFVVMHSSCFKLSLPIMIHENFIGCCKHS